MFAFEHGSNTSQRRCWVGTRLSALRLGQVESSRSVSKYTEQSLNVGVYIGRIALILSGTLGSFSSNQK